MARYSRPSEPLSISGVLDDGLRLFRVSIGPLFVLALPLALLSEGLDVAMMHRIDLHDPASVNAALATLFPAMLIVFVVACFLYAAMIGRLDWTAGGESSTLARALQVGVARFVPLFIGWLLWGLAVAAGSILLVIPGMYLMVTLSFMSFPLVLDGRGPLASLKISHGLVKGFWWRTGTLLTVAVIIAMVPYLVVTFMLGFMAALMNGGNSLPWIIIQWLLASVVSAFVVTMMLCFTYGIYRDLLLRRSGASPA